MDIKEPASDIIVLKKMEKKNVSEGGIALPENMCLGANDDKIGIVDMMGCDIDCVAVGDTVAFSHNYAQVVNLGDKLRIFVKRENILAILN